MRSPHGLCVLQVRPHQRHIQRHIQLLEEVSIKKREAPSYETHDGICFVNFGRDVLLEGEICIKYYTQVFFTEYERGASCREA